MGKYMFLREISVFSNFFMDSKAIFLASKHKSQVFPNPGSPKNIALSNSFDVLLSQLVCGFDFLEAYLYLNLLLSDICEQMFLRQNLQISLVLFCSSILALISSQLFFSIIETLCRILSKGDF